MIVDELQKAIDGDALMGKSKAYIRRALRCKIEGDHDQYQLWASLALELLGKSALARIHPSLIVDPTHYKSLFAASRINVSTDIRTITAHTLFERFDHLLPEFDESVKSFCEGLSRRRNAELHSGEVPFHGMMLGAWERRYWHAAELVLRMAGSSLDEWLGAEDSTAPKEIMEQATEATMHAVRIRIEQSGGGFRKLANSMKENARKAAAERGDRNRELITLEEPDAFWDVECPGCHERAVVAGMQYGEEIVEDVEPSVDSFGLWEIVERRYVGEELHCPVCGLHLKGSAEIAAGDVEAGHTEFEEREAEYQAEYMNE